MTEGLNLCSSAKMHPIRDLVAKVAGTNTTVLVRGESGVGKEVVARAIHKASPRAQKQFLKVNCAALPGELLESELFGHEKGAFTGAYRQKPGKFEAADGGTLLLDEIGEMPLRLQAKLLHVLQDGEFSRVGGERVIDTDVRLIASTNRDLEAAMRAHQFREDLYYRLNVIEIRIPPLRERREEIPGLIEEFRRRFNAQYSRTVEIPQDTVRAFLDYHWPGNIRELENTIERAILLAEGRAIAPGDLRLGEVPTAGSGRESASVVKIPPTGIPLEDVERHALIEALKMSNWVQKDAAELLSISPRVMNYKIKTLGIEFPRGRRAAPLPPPDSDSPIAAA